MGCLLHDISHRKPLALEEGGVVGLPAEEVLEEVHAVHGAAGLEDHVPVVQPGLEVEDTLLVKPGLEHVLAVHLGPQVTVILCVISNCKMQYFTKVNHKN